MRSKSLLLYFIFLFACISFAHAKQTNVILKAGGELKNTAQTGKHEISRTEKSVIYDNGDGTITREITPFKRNYKGADGKYHEIKNYIAESSGRYRVAENPISPDFPAGSGDNDIISVSSGSASLSWKLKSISLVDKDGAHPVILTKHRKNASAAKNRIRYEGVFENVTDIYAVAPGRMKNDLILKKLPVLPANKSAEYLKITGEYGLPPGSKVTVDGNELTGRTETEQGFEISVPGQDAFVIEGIQVFENYNDTKMASAASFADSSVKGKYLLDIRNGKLFVSILVPYSWLSDSARKYPVNIDPSVWLKSYWVNYYSLTYDAQIGSIYSSNYGKNIYFWVGNNPSASSIMRAVLDFSEADALTTTLPVSSATLSLNKEAFLIGANGVRQIEVHELTRSFTEGTGTDASPKTDGVTWLKYDATNSWTTPGGDFKPEIISQADALAGGLIEYIDFDITKLAYAWSKGTAAKNGILLKLTDAQENSKFPFGIRFTSYDATDDWPIVRVTYFTGKDTSFYSKSRAMTVAGYGSNQYLNLNYPYTFTGGSAIVESFDLAIGSDSTNGGPFRSFVQFDLNSLPRNISVTAASIMIYGYAVMGANQTRPTDMHRLTAPWEQQTGSWVSRTANTLWTAPGGDYDPAFLDSVIVPKTPGGYYQFTLPVNVAEGWIEGSVPNYGVMFKATSEGSNDVGFYAFNFDANDLSSSVTTDPYNYMPVFNITFTAEAGFTPPELLNPAGGETADKMMIINWRWGSDSTLGDPLNLTYQLEYSDNGGASWNLITNTLAKVNYYVWDTSLLSSSGNYMVRVRAYNGSTYSTYSSSPVFSVLHSTSELQVLSAVAAPATLQSGDDVTVVLNIANTNWREAARVGMNGIFSSTVAGSAAAINTQTNNPALIPPLMKSSFTWVYKTTGSGTMNFTGTVKALSGSGPSDKFFNSFDSNAPLLSNQASSNNVVVLASTPSETPTFTETQTMTPSYTYTPTPMTGVGATWTLANASCAFGTRYGHSMVNYKGYMWIIAGIANSAYQKDVWRSDNGVDWALVTGNAGFTPRFRQRVVVFNDGTGEKMYMMGGFDGTNVLSDVWKSSDGITWTKATGNPGWYLRQHMGACVYNGYIWVIGGDDNTTAFSDVWRSRNGTDWEFVTTGAAFGARTNTEAVVFDDGGGEKMFIIGGSTSPSIATAVNSVYSSSDGINWTLRTSMSGNRAIHRAFVYKGKIYAAAGHSGAAYLSDVISTSNGNSWTSETASAFTARNNLGAVVYADRMWVTGGYNGAGMTDCRYSPQLPTPTITPTITPGGCVPVNFGNMAATAGSVASSAGTIVFVKYVIGEGGTVNNIYLKMAATANAYVGIYSDNAGTPNTRLVMSASQAVASGWNTFSVTPTHLNAGTYWLAFQKDTLAATWYDTGVLGDSISLSGSFGTWAATYPGGGTNGSNKYGIYAGYLPDSCGTPTLTVTRTFTQTQTQSVTATVTSTGTKTNTQTSTSTATQSITPTVTLTQTAGMTPGADWVLATGNAQFGGRSGGVLLPFNGKMYLIAGTNGAAFNDVWSSINGAAWVQETASAFATTRSYHTGAVFNNKMWIISGVTGAYDDDVWSSVNGSAWIQETAAAGFPARASSKALVHNGKLWIIAGRDNTSAYLNDVWNSANGVDWVAVTRNAEFPVRWQHEALSYNGKIYVMGGINASLLNDVWSSADGVYWTQETANAAFAARRGFGAVTYDDGTGMKMWVYSGLGAGYYNDVWYSVNGSTWTQKTAAANFSTRGLAQACVFNGGMWVVSGNNGSYPNDAWYSGNVVQPTATPVNSFTVTPTVSLTITSTVTQSATASITATVTKTVTQTQTQTITQTVTRTITATVTQSSSPTMTATGSITGTVTPTATQSITQTVTQTVTQSNTPTMTSTGTVTGTVTPTATQSITATVTATVTQSNTPTMTITSTLTQSVTLTVTGTVTGTNTQTVTGTHTQTSTTTNTQSVTQTMTQTVTQTITGTVTGTVTQTATATITMTVTKTVTQTVTATITATNTQSVTPSMTQSVTQTLVDTTTITPTVTQTSTKTVTGTVTQTVTGTFTGTDTQTVTQTVTATVTQSVTQSITQTATKTSTPTVTESATPADSFTSTVTRTDTQTATQTVTKTVTRTATPSVTQSVTQTNTMTSTNTDTPTDTNTPTDTPTFTHTFTPTHTFTHTGTPTDTATSTQTPTFTNTYTATHTYTVTNTFTDTATFTVTHTFTVTPTFTQTPTPNISNVLDRNIVDASKGDKLKVKIKLESAGTKHVKIKVFTIVGELIRTIEADISSSGWNEIEWDLKNEKGRTAGRGIYLIKIENEGSVETRKIYIDK